MTTELDRWASEIWSELDFLEGVLRAEAEGSSPGFVYDFRTGKVSGLQEAKDRIESVLECLRSSVSEPEISEPPLPILKEVRVLLDADGNIYADTKGLKTWIGQINKRLPQSEDTTKFLLWAAARALVNQREEEIFRDHEKNHTRLT